MVSQQVLFAETIAGMKKALKRKAYESDSDSEIENQGNRGNKLKKRARFARQGQLVPTQGPSAYNEVDFCDEAPSQPTSPSRQLTRHQSVDFAGSRRTIIYRNRPLVDEEGYEIDSDDDDRVDEATLAAAELNPYANIRLEQILAPLTASTALPSHSTLSKSFVSKTLTNLVSQSCDLGRRENQSLWRTRHLWTSLCGDGTWMPCGLMIGLNDEDLYREDHVTSNLQGVAKENGAKAISSEASSGDARRDCRDGPLNAAGLGGGRPETARCTADMPMTDASVVDNQAKSGHGESAVTSEPNIQGSSDARQQVERVDNGSLWDQKNVDEAVPKSSRDRNATDDGTNEKRPQCDVKDERGDTMMKDALATDLGSEPRKLGEHISSVTSEDAEFAFIHPIFTTPAGAKPDRNLGLPGHEAEDIRRLLALYVQKQEEICRGATKLHHGLLKAERLRKDVLHWAKAEAHCGPNRDMSDGEDWYDKEEWGLTEDLKKGQDEEEEDTTTAGKKTRNRR